MQQRTVIYIILAIAILLGSCGRRPRYVVHEDKMTDVLYDIQLAQAIYRSGSAFGSDEKKDALLNGILEKHEMTRAELDSSLLWYSDNIEIYNTINDSVASRLRAAGNAMMPAGSNARDYLIPPFCFLNEQMPTMSFNMDSSKIKTVDLAKFSLRFDVQGLSHLQKVEAAIFFIYKDTLVKEIVPVEENVRYTFAKPQLADSLLENISGYVHLENKVKGISPDVILYNICYQDSIADAAPVSGISSADKPDEDTVRNIQIDNKEMDDRPVILKDKADRSPLTRRGRYIEPAKKAVNAE
ncbi:MAG: DUF4296 domain-containing protein [Prevotella sp.]|jgi:hypothetical protein|nr:DUF4296 domain-containing protein [Prevotella sp.]